MNISNPIKVNVYYLNNKGEQHVVYSTYLAQGLRWVESIIASGGEVTSVINSADAGEPTCPVQEG